MNTMKIEWKDSYLLDDTLIDRQHRELFALANVAVSAAEQSVFRLASMALYRYMQKHFSDERVLMRELNFPGYQRHIELHNSMLSKFSTITREIVQGQWPKEDIHALITQWFRQHMEEEDAQIATHNRSAWPKQ